MSIVNIKTEKLEEENEIAKDLPKPLALKEDVKEPIIHRPIRIKSESDLQVVVGNAVDRLQVPQTSCDGPSSNSTAEAVHTHNEINTAPQTIRVKPEFCENRSDEFLDELMEDVDKIANAATLNDSLSTTPKQEQEYTGNNDGRDDNEFTNKKSGKSKSIPTDITHLSTTPKITEEQEYTGNNDGRDDSEFINNKSGKSKSIPIDITQKHSPNKCTESSYPTFEDSMFSRRKISPDIFPSKKPSSQTQSSSLPANKRRHESTSNLHFKRIKLGNKTLNCDGKSVEKPMSSSKREQALSRVSVALTKFAQLDNNTLSSNFIYTSTVRKLPTSCSFITQQMHENRSPLHAIKNVSYKFNSNTNDIQIQNWGLEYLPQIATQVAKILRIDARTIYQKSSVTKFPSGMEKVKSKNLGNEETIDQPLAVLYRNSMTQTDDQYGFRRKTLNIGVQTKMPLHSTTASQTTNIMPFLSKFEQLNDYQMLAINDFAELLREPGNLANDIYQLRQRLLDIYKTSLTSTH